MGKGDIKTKKGKITRGTYGKTRKKKKPVVMAAPKKKVAKKAAPKKAAAKAAPKAAPKAAATDLTKMTVKDLKEMAASKKIEVPAKAKKADIIALLS